MQGVFGAGVATALQEANLYPRIHSVYSSSAGAHNAAYFLSRQTRLGSSIYYEDLTGRQFIHVERLWRFIGGCVRRLWDRRAPIRALADLDYLITEVEQKRKPLDIAAIVRQPIHWWVHGYDISRHSWTWLDGKRDTWATLKATATATPYYPQSVPCQGRSIIDGSVIRSTRMLDVARDHPDKIILYIRNRRRTRWGVVRELPGRFLDSILAAIIHNWRVGWALWMTAFDFPLRRRIEALSNVILIENQLGSNAIETDAQELRRIYAHGIAAGQAALQQLSRFTF